MYWHTPNTIPHTGYVLVWIEFPDSETIPPVRVVRWQDDPHGFNLLESDDGASWNIRGLKAWMPLPDEPSVNLDYYYHA